MLPIGRTEHTAIVVRNYLRPDGNLDFETKKSKSCKFQQKAITSCHKFIHISKINHIKLDFTSRKKE